MKHLITHSDTLIDFLGGMCFLGLFFGILLSLYVIAPKQPSMHSETPHAEWEQ